MRCRLEVSPTAWKTAAMRRLSHDDGYIHDGIPGGEIVIWSLSQKRSEPGDCHAINIHHTGSKTNFPSLCFWYQSFRRQIMTTMNPFETGEYCGLPSAHLRDRGISRCRSNSEVGDACLVRAFRFTQRLTGLNVKDMIHKLWQNRFGSKPWWHCVY